MDAVKHSTRLRFIPPLLPALVDDVPEGDKWLHEIKYDGYRTQIILNQDVARVFTRNGFDWSERYRPIADCAQTLLCSSAIIDGEMIIQDESGRSDFHALRASLETAPERLILMAFDLLHLDGEDLRSRPLEERRERLRDLLGPNVPERRIHFSEHMLGNGAAFFAAAERMGLEGIVSKRLGSRYRSGPSRVWLKTKSYGEEELVLIGTAKGDRAPVALLAREEEDGALTYVGGAMVTLAQPERDLFWQTAELIRAPKPPVPMEPRKETGWVRPEMRVKVRTLRGEEMLRHATVTALARVPPTPEARAVRKTSRNSKPEPRFRAPEIDHGALAAYYEQIAPVMLPWVASRPLNLVRCAGSSCWFQRNVSHPVTEPGTFPPAIKRVPVLQKNGKTEEYLFTQDAAGLMACLDADGVEFHGWGSRIEDIEKPDRLVIDLDPDAGLDFNAVREAALDVRRAFDRLKLKSFPLLSGGKGIHVVVPLTPRAEWPEVREFALRFCQALAEAEPHRFTIALPKAQRRGRIFLDYLRNQRTSTAILPYSVRARHGLPIAAPIAWSEVHKAESAAKYTACDTSRLLRRAGSRLLAGWGVANQELPRN